MFTDQSTETAGAMRTNSGYSLIELLTVIAIIAILAAMLFPVFASVREKGRASSCISNEQQLGLGMLAYMQDYDERFPSGVLPATAAKFWGGEGWAGQCRNYLMNSAVFVCPDDTTTGDQPDDFVVSYAYNINLVEGGDSFGEVNGTPARGRYVETLVSPQKTVMLFEVAGVTANVTDDQEGAEPGGPAGEYFSASGNGLDNRLYAHKDASTWPDNQYATGYLGGRPPSPPSQFQSAVGRHSGGSHFLLADGHVRWLRGSAVSSGINAPQADCNQDDNPPKSGCAIGNTVLAAAGTQSTTPFSATFSVK